MLLAIEAELGHQIVPSLIRPLALELHHIDRAIVSLGLEQSIESPLHALEGPGTVAMPGNPNRLC